MNTSTVQNLDKRQIIATLTQHREVLKYMGVERIALFGSYARETTGPASDVDLLVELKEPKYLLLLQLTEYLTELLGHKVDLKRNKPHLKRCFLDAVENNLAYV